MTPTFSLDELSEDTKNWIVNYEQYYGKIGVKEGQIFTNSLGKTYFVLKDSPENFAYVWVKTDCPQGICKVFIPKALLMI